jgi:hypothetical protein
VRVLIAALLLGALAGCGGDGGTTAVRVTSRAAPKIHVRLTAQSHHPRVGKPWRYEVRVTDAAGRPVAADLHLQILFGGVAVGQIGRHHVPDGVWRETIGAGPNPPFPARSRGQPLVLQAIATAGGRTGSATYWIRVR